LQVILEGIKLDIEHKIIKRFIIIKEKSHLLGNNNYFACKVKRELAKFLKSLEEFLVKLLL